MNPIVGLGEVLWDIYPDGRKVAGGAPFNFAFHCHQLGHPAVIVSRVGNDDLGRELRERVRELGLSDEFIQTDPKHPTGTVRVQLDAAGQPSYEIAAGVAWDHIDWTKPLAELIRGAGVVYHGTLALRSGTTAARTGTSAGTILRAAQLKSVRGKRKGFTIYDMNLRGREPNAQAIWAARWIKVNEDEEGDLHAAIDRAMDDDPWPRTPEGMLDYLHHYSKMDDRVFLITRGAAGCEIQTRGASFRQPGFYANVVDTVGAGDAFTAAMLCLHLEGRSLPECARFAGYYAARVCEHPGATPTIDRAEVERATGTTPRGRP